MNSTPSFIGQAQGSGDTRSMFLQLFAGEVIAAAQSVLQFKDKINWKELRGGKSYQFPFTGGATVGYHVPGTEITGNLIAKKAVTVDPDDAQIAHVFLDNLDEALSHFDARSQHAKDVGYAIAELTDKNIMRSILMAARSAAVLTEGKAGTVLPAVANYATDGATLFGGLLDAQLALKNNKVLRAGDKHYAALAPLQYSIVMRSDKMANNQYRPDANSEDMRYEKINGMYVLESTNTPFGETYDANSTVVKAAYNGNFSNTVAAVWTDYAAAAVEVEGLDTKIIDQPHKRGTLILASQSVGIRPLNPACAVELKKA